MTSRTLNLLLALAFLAAGIYAFELQTQLQTARNERDRLSAEKAKLDRQISDLRKSGSASSGLPAILPMPESPGKARMPGPQVLGMPPQPGMGAGPMGGRFNALMNNPEAQRLMAIQQKAALDSRYASLFRALSLSPADLEKFKSLLVERQTTVMDAMTAARAQGLTGPDNREALQQVIAAAQAEVDNNIRGTLDDAAFAQYQTYEQTLPERNVVTQLQQRLSYSTAPLTDEQSNQIIALLAANAPERAQGSGPSNAAVFATINPGGGPGPFRGSGGAPITDAVIAGSQGILNSTQIAALTQLQQEQQAQAQLAAQFRAGRQAASGPAYVPVPGPPHP